MEMDLEVASQLFDGLRLMPFDQISIQYLDAIQR